MLDNVTMAAKTSATVSERQSIPQICPDIYFAVKTFIR